MKLTSGTVALIIAGSIAVLALMGVLGTMSIYNHNVALEMRYEAQRKIVETTLDKMKKDLVNQYQVSQEFAETYIKVTQMNAEGRKGGSLFKSVQEASGATQGFTPEISAKMMNTIGGNLSEFQKAQNLWVDVWREQNAYCKPYPNKWVIGGREKPEPLIISSSSTKTAVATGVQEDKLLK